MPTVNFTDLIPSVQAHDRYVSGLESKVDELTVLVDEIRQGDKIIDDALIALYEAVEALCGREMPLDEAIMLGQSAMAKASFIRASL